MMRLLLLSALLVLGGLSLPGPEGAWGQEAVVRAEESFRAERDGQVLGRLMPGTRLLVVERDGDWTRATLEGVVWLRSMQVLEDEEYDLVISEADGENLRDEPSGRIAARLVRGVRLEELERVPGWARVRRTAWVRTPSLELADETPADRRDEDPGTERERTDVDDRFVGLDRPAPVLSAPDGDTLGQVRPGSGARVLARDGNWARVRLEGWVWMPEREAGEDPGDAPVLTGLEPRELAEEPDRFRGRMVELELQFVSLERAERVRTDFYEGEPFLLTRSPQGERIFVYVAVPPDRLEEVDRLTPLERIRVVGRVRTGAAALTENPILDLVEVERIRR